jgi:hypothetical protein
VVEPSDAERSGRVRLPVIGSGLSLARRATSAATDAAGRAALAGLDALLDWEVTDEAVKRVLASPVADRAVGHALRGPLVDAIARDITRYAVLERVTDELVSDDAELERVVGAALDSPVVERLAAQVIESRLLDTIVERLLDSEDLWLLVDEIAQSPAVTDAISHQSVGFADQVAGQVRVRSRRADAGLERAARRLLRRK